MGGGGLLFSLPSIVAEFHWCASCNYNCMHCSYRQRRVNNSRLSLEVNVHTINDLKKLGTKAVYLSGGGEPTTLKDWDKYAEYILEAEMVVVLITNSVAIKEKHYDMLRRFNYIAVSVYSTQKENYKKIVDSNFFKRQFELPSKIKNAYTNTIVGARCVINSIL